MSSIQVRLDGDADRLIRKLYSLSNIDKKGITNALAEGIRTSTVERFKEQTDPEGRPWPPSIRVRENGGKTLIQSSALRNSIHASSGATGFAVGTNTVYAATHQFGARDRTIRAKKKKGLAFMYRGELVLVKKVTVNIPARPFLGISKEDHEEILDTLQEALEEEG